MFEHDLKNIPPLNLPMSTLKIKTDTEGKVYYWDAFRKKWGVLTPEEFVRQQSLFYLVNELGYPVSWLSVEKEITLFHTRKRYDAVFFNPQRNPVVLLECKSWKVPLNASHVQQLWRYNLEAQAPALLLTNGINHWMIVRNTLVEKIPDFKSILMLTKDQ